MISRCGITRSGFNHFWALCELCHNVEGGMRYSAFIRKDIDFINERAAWTADQKAVWEELLKDERTDEGIMLELCMRNARKYYRIKREVADKVARIISDNEV